MLKIISISTFIKPWVAMSLILISHATVADQNQVTESAAGISTLPDPLAAGWQGDSVCEKLHEDDVQRVLRCRFDPGIGHEKHFHARHFGYALSGGKMRIEDASGTRDVTLKTGSSYTSLGTEWHQVLNIGDTTVTYLIVEPLD